VAVNLILGQRTIKEINNFYRKMIPHKMCRIRDIPDPGLKNAWIRIRNARYQYQYRYLSFQKKKKQNKKPRNDVARLEYGGLGQ
jgi:hypothetical protein